MSKNMTRKGLAFGAGFALVATGLAAMPAQAAPGDLVTLAPEVGLNSGIFISDAFALNSFNSSQVNATNMAFKVDNPGQDLLQITIQRDTDGNGVVDDNFADQVDITGFNAQGSYSNVSLNQSLNNGGEDGTFIIDMEEAGLVSLVLSDIQDDGAQNDTGHQIAIKPLKSVTNDTGTAEVQFINEVVVGEAIVITTPNGTELSYTPAANTETGADVQAGLRADAQYATAGVVVDAADGDVIEGAGADTVDITLTYPAASGDVEMATVTLDGAAGTVTETTEGEDTGLYDFSTDEDKIFDVHLANDTETALEYGAGDVTATVTAWVESEAPVDFDDVDSTYASEPVSVTWYDPKGVVVVPRVERIDGNLNDDAGGNMFATIEFNKPINLEMFDINQWTYDVTTNGLPSFDGDDPLVEETDVAGYGSAAVNADNFGRYVFDTAQAITAGTTYTLSVHSVLAEDATNVTRWFSAAGYSISEGYTAANDIEVLPEITDTADVDFDPAAGTGTTFATAAIRAGVNSVTYEAELTAANGDELEVVSVPMLAVVTAGSFMPTGSSISVAGNASPITAANQVRHVTGFTDSDGDFRVTVTSAVANKDESYVVEFYVLNNGNFENDGLDGAETARIEASYGAADAGTESLKPVDTVVAGAEVTVAFDIEDQFGEAISETAKGKALNVSLAAPVTDNLNVAAAVVDGEVSFTFTNYLTVGSSDLLTATLYTGTASDPNVIDTETITLYNTGATGAVQIPEVLNGSVTYDDYIPNGEKVTAGVNVNPDNDIELTGTVVDANGVGIPAAVVTISAPGMQIQEEGSSRYYQDEHTINANAAGVFDVNLNAHIVNTDGVEVTVTTADDKSATTLVKTYFPEDTGLTTGDAAGQLDGDNLVFSVETPDQILMNQTYAVTAKLTDKWGNPVKTGGNAVEFQGTGSIELNGLTEVIDRDFDKNGEALVYVRSVKDIAGPGTLSVTLDGGAATYTAWDVSATETIDLGLNFAEFSTDVKTTAFDETVFENSFSEVVEVFETAADAPSDTKVNAGSFKGFVAVYAKGYEGARLSAKIGNDWVIVPSLASNFERVTDFTGAGVDIAVRIYIDRVLIDTINLTTK